MSKKFEVPDQEALLSVAQELLSSLKNKVVLLKGDMGAGKTTLVKAVCSVLGVEDEVSSPTFSLVNEYQGARGELILHFDWYRLEDPIEALEIGFEDYLERGDYLFMEWPEKISTLIPPNFDLINIEVISAERRLIHLSHHA